MKKIIKIIPLIIVLFVTIGITYSFFSTSKTLPSVFKTDGYTFLLNASGGTFDSNNKVIVLNQKATLPVPNRKGYNFLGYSKTQNGSVDYSTSINNINEIIDKQIYAKWSIISYSISYNLNGGSISNNKTSYNVEDTFTLPKPNKTGYTFEGWTGSNGSTKQTTVTISKGTTGNLNYTANWNKNSYTVDVNPVIDGTTYTTGLDGYTFDVWVDGNLVADDVIDWCQSISYGSTVRVKANGLTGISTSFDKTITVGTESIDINPTWSINTYQAHFYLDGVHRLTTYNKYGAYISTPNTSASALGYDGNFYYISGYTPWTSWYQPDYVVGFTINISEYNCVASFGNAGTSNAESQNSKLKAAGYNFCSVANWGAIECYGSYSQVMGLYNNAWNILPKSGSGFSIYKQISCDSGWGTYHRR